MARPLHESRGLSQAPNIAKRLRRFLRSGDLLHYLRQAGDDVVPTEDDKVQIMKFRAMLKVAIRDQSDPAILAKLRLALSSIEKAGRNEVAFEDETQAFMLFFSGKLR